MESTAAIDDNTRWSEALAAVGLGEDAVGPAPDLCLFFASPAYDDLEGLVAEAYRRTAASVLIGCSGQGIVGGGYTVRSVVAQGAAPIGEPWTITGTERNVLRTVGNRPALEVLRDTLNGLSEEMRGRAARNLLVGLVMNEYQDRFEQGDFLI